jgi:branched-chain amino acid aminotransferase
MHYNFDVTRTANSHLADLDFGNIPFGKIFTDHMFTADYIGGQWTNLKIVPVAPLEIHPGNMAWHYGQSIFEGMKASRDKEGNALLFRPELHSKRLNASARRMCMPELPEDLFLQAIHTIVDMEKAWIPPAAGSALYIRPFMFATDETIGVKASETYKFIIFVMPVGPYYNQPVKLFAQDTYVRAVVGGVGEAKTAGNYAASLYPANEARKKGFDQVMWLDGIHRKYIQEVGTMNIFFVINGEVITPNLDGAILDGITRKTIIELLKDKGHTVIERPISIDEIVEAHQNHTLSEVFGSGTAAVIAQVSTIQYEEHTVTVDVSATPISTMIKDTINGLRNRTIEDKFGWVVPAKP